MLYRWFYCLSYAWNPKESPLTLKLLKEQYFPVVLYSMLYKVVLCFKSVDEILKSDNSNEIKLLSCTFLWCCFLSCTRWFPFWVCGWNPKVWPFKRKLLSGTFLWYCLLCCTRQGKTKVLSCSPGLVKQPIGLTCFNYELNDRQAIFAKIKWMLVKEGLGGSARMLQASKLQQQLAWRESNFLTYISPCKVLLPFESVDKILKCDHSSESYWAVLCWDAVYYAVQGGSIFWVCGWNPKIWQFKWKLLSCTLLWCCLLCCTRWLYHLSMWRKS